MFFGQEKAAPDSEVQVVSLSLEIATRPFPLASSVSLLALRQKDEYRRHAQGADNVLTV